MVWSVFKDRVAVFGEVSMGKEPDRGVVWNPGRGTAKN